jgi:putative membrane-bound dehydrogenase-like protein
MNFLRIWVLGGIIQVVLTCGNACAFGGEQAIGPVSSPEVTNGPGPFQIKEGFRIDVVAAEPTVPSPCAMAFDENGRLFVVEQQDFVVSHGQSQPSGRVRLLEDADGNGKYEKSAIYADNLPWASAVACYGGGIFVASGADIVYLKDTKSDGKVDVRKVAFTGFGGGKASFGPDSLVNNFNWGLDNRIHGASGRIGGVISSPGVPGSAAVSLFNSDFSFDPRTMTISSEAGPAQSGSTFDNAGRRFISDLDRPLKRPMYDPRYSARNPFFARRGEIAEVANPATPVFRFISEEVTKPGTNRPPARTFNGMTASSNPELALSWLTNARGCVVYRGSAFPAGYVGDVFVADTRAGLIHHLNLRERGLDLTAERAPDERTTEFLFSRDPSFHPVQIINGPEGGLYVADIREGGENGRIYRIVPANFRQPRPPQFGKATAYDLCATLSQTNGWNRDTAARLLYERKEAAAAQLLTNVVKKSQTALGRLHALHALEGFGPLTEAQLQTALRDQDERVREHAVKLVERLTNKGAVSDQLWNQLASLAANPSPRVRYQLALTLGELRRPEKVQVLADLLRRDLDNPWMRTAALSSLIEGAGTVFVSLADDAGVRNNSAGQQLLLQLATMIGLQGRTEEVKQVADFVSQDRFIPQPAFGWLYALGDGSRLARNSLAMVDRQGRSQKCFDLALNMALYGTRTESARVDSIRLLGVGPYSYADIGEPLLLLLDYGEPQSIQSAVIATLGHSIDPRLAPSLIARWQVLAPVSRNEAVGALLARNERVPNALAAIENGIIRDVDLSSAQINFLRTHRDPGISGRAARLFGPLTPVRPEVVKRFRPALQGGNAPRGAEIFRSRCASCHQFGLQGQSVGPDLSGVKTWPKERILSAILEPNAEVPPEYATQVVQTQDGEILLGLKADETLATVTLRQPNRVAVVLPRGNIQFIQPQPWSMMPDGLDQGMAPADMADLLAFLTTARGQGNDE